MGYFFSWAEEGEKWEEGLFEKEPLSIFSFKLSQHEGEVATLKMSVGDYEYRGRNRAFFWYENPQEGHFQKLLFQGELINIPLKEADNTWTLEFRACVDREALSNLCRELQVDKDLVELFFPNGADPQNPTIILEDRPEIIEFDRMRGSCAQSSISNPHSVLNFDRVFKESTSLKVTHLPYDSVDVEVEAQWGQKDQGEVDIAPALSAAFPLGFINTYTGTHFEQSFPRAGDKLGVKRGRSGCRIVESSLKEVDPPQTGSLALYPRMSPPLWMRDDDGERTQIKLKRSWFKSSLIVEWFYAQKRKESAIFTLKTASKKTKNTKKLKYVLNHIPTSMGGSFFKSPLGLKALQYAFNRGKTHLQASQRCLEVMFEIPLVDGLDLRMDAVVDVSKLLKKEAPLMAKIIGYTMTNQGGVGVCKIRTSLCLNMIGEGDGQDHFTPILEGFSPRGILNTTPLHTLEIVKNVTLRNGAEWQENLMGEGDHDEEIDVLDLLKKYPTSFEVALQDLKTEGVLEERIDFGEVMMKHTITMNALEVCNAH